MLKEYLALIENTQGQRKSGSAGGSSLAGVLKETSVFDPRPVALDWVEGRVPVTGGFIEALIEKKKGGGYQRRIKAPASATLVCWVGPGNAAYHAEDPGVSAPRLLLKSHIG